MTADLATYAETIDEACNSHDTERLLSLCSPEYTGSDVSQATTLHGREDLRLMLETYLKAFPDLRFITTDMIIQGSRLALVWVAKGTHQGPIMNIPPTGRKVEVRGVSVIDVEDGLVVRGHTIWDLAGMLRHMGLPPEL
ncbi:MAG TPA: ester cyclase [Anaerolineales bacterium]|nr:ester cyclase [Anaerolineales bacterium]